MIYAQLLFFAVVAFFAYAYYEGWKDEKKLAGRLDRGLHPEDYGWSPVRDSLIGQYWRHESGMAMLMPSVIYQCYMLEIGHQQEDGYIHFEKATQVNESGKLEPYFIPWPLLKEDLIQIESLVGSPKPLQPNHLQTYLQSV
jgi:hypothetical protein